MKYFLSLLISLVFIIASTAMVSAENSEWEISEFDSQLTVQYDGKVSVAETLAVDFKSLDKHGIYRDLPYLYSLSGEDYYTEVQINSVRRNNQDEPYELITSDAQIRLKIGSVNSTISGQQHYQISYTVAGIITQHDGFDELYWNVTGDGWDAPILQTSASVSLPRAGIVQLACYQGFRGATTSCDKREYKDAAANFTNEKILVPGMGLTIAVGFDKGMVPVLRPEKPKGPYEVLLAELTSPTYLTLIIVAAIAGLSLPIWWWWKRGRDWWWQTPDILESNQSAQLKPWRRKPQVVVEFEPPEQLRPAQIGVLLDEQADTLDITSTIVDLASRGYLTIKELPKTWLLGSPDYELNRTSKVIGDLLPYEQKLLNSMFEDKAKITLSSLKNTFYDDLAKIKKEVYADLMQRGYFSANPQTTRAIYVGIGFGLLAISIGLAWAGYSLVWAWIFVLAAITATAGVATLFISFAMPQRTALGFELYRRSLGYKLFIATAEKYRQRFFESQNVFTQVLPYAMMLGLTDKLAQAMQQIGYQPPAPTWYSSVQAFNISQFATNMNSISRALSSTMASAPSGSGSGGGGSSGGGFGGGGGGSW